MLLSLLGKIGQDLFPESFVGDDFKFIHQLHILLRDQHNHIIDQLVVEMAGLGTGMQQFIKGKKKDVTVSSGPK